VKILENFAVFEGGDSSGTTSQLELLKEHLRNMAVPFLATFEPTDGPIGRLIRSALKKEISVGNKSLAMLFAADRNEHVFGPSGVAERCAKGELVVSDRYVLSSLAYQGVECGDDFPMILNSSFPAPELLFFFDIDPKIAIDRIKNRPSPEIFEYLEFQVKVREKYLNLLNFYRDSDVKVTIIDAAESREEIFSRVWSVLSQMPIIKRALGRADGL
jgi:dTMP kinase